MQNTTLCLVWMFRCVVIILWEIATETLINGGPSS
uniref:Uncharacterized protein n=1 Tax=Arundo donax TaxID=35708 RepID=A0A0A8ZNR1_ARUDO